MKTLAEVLPKFHEGFMIINYDTNKRFELVHNIYGATYVKVTYQEGTEQRFLTEKCAFENEDTTGTHWGVCYKC